MISLYQRMRKKNEAKPKPSKPPCAHRAREQAETAAREELPTSGGVTAEGTPLPEQDGKCIRCQDERRAARKYRWKIILGLIFPFALQALDVTIIASALPWIAIDFREVSQLNWIISAFNLTSAAFVPFWGQMADIFGRYSVIQGCVVVMIVGSALCTAAPTYAFPMLLLGRGIQGLGCSGISVVVRIILADKVSLKENAKNWSIFSFTAGMSYALGPVIGGYLTSTNYRWCFGINLPICAVAVVVIFFMLRKELLGPQPIPGLDDDDNAVGQARHDEEQQNPGNSSSAVPVRRLAAFSARLSTIDVGGQLLFLFGFGLLILGITWGGATYEWYDAAVLAPLCIGVVLVGVFIFWERLMAQGKALAQRWPHQKPMLPWKLITNRDIGLLLYINFATGAAMYAVLYFTNLFFTLVKLYDASKAGVQLLYYTPGIGAGVYLSVLLCNSWPRKTFVPLMLGSIVEAVGVGVLAWALWHDHVPTVYGMMALTGAGTGLRFMPGSLHGIGFFPNNIATVMSLMAIMTPFGGTVTLTIMSTVFNNLSGFGRNSDSLNYEVLVALPAAVQEQVRSQAKTGIVWAFVSITPFMVLCIIAASLLGNVDITKEPKGEGEEGYGEHVMSGIYLLHLLRKLRRRKEVAAASSSEGDDVEKLRSMSTPQGNGEKGQHEVSEAK